MEIKEIKSSNYIYIYLAHIYRIVIPEVLRVLIKRQYNEQKYRKYKQRLRTKIIDYYKNKDIQNDITKLISFLKNNSIQVFPYEFSKKYKNIKILKDREKKLLYTIYNNKKIYFRKDYTSSYAKKYFRSLLIEQDIDSAHRYLNNDFSILPNYIVADIGAAEGIFAIDIIDIAIKVYIFEADENWIEALKITFEPWKEKVTIVKAYVTNSINKENCISLNNFFENKSIDFLKIDVEGAENKVLEGASEIFKRENNLKIAICTYHKQNDAENILKLLNQNNFICQFSKGYMLNFHDKNIAPPYFRKGLIRASKL